VSRASTVSFLAAALVALAHASAARAQEPQAPPQPQPEAPPQTQPTPPLIIILPPAPFPVPVEPPPSTQTAAPVPELAPPPSTPPVVQVPSRPRHKETRLAFRVEGGATFSTLYDVSIKGGEATLGVGAEFAAPLAVYVSFTVFGGVQETGLAAMQYHVTGTIEGRFGRFRLGGGLALGELSLWRATSDENTLAPTAGVVAFTSLDLVQWGGPTESETGALYLQARLRVDSAVVADAAPTMWGPSFGLGARF